jgi:hypothetical protein
VDRQDVGRVIQAAAWACVGSGCDLWRELLRRHNVCARRAASERAADSANCLSLSMLQRWDIAALFLNCAVAGRWRATTS